jgi:hypothetical protein
VILPVRAYRVEIAAHDLEMSEKEATRYVRKVDVQLRK